MDGSYSSDEIDAGYDDEHVPNQGSHPNAQGRSQKIANYQPQDKVMKRYLERINVEKYEGPELPNHAANTLIQSTKKAEADR